jgi:hypothetical protein
MPLRLIFFLSFFVCASATTSLLAESNDCGAPVLMIADGRLTQGMFAQSTTYWFGIYAQSNHSYSVEFEPPNDNFVNSSHAVFSAISVFGPTDSLAGCRGTSSVIVTQNSGYSPAIMKNGNGAGRRISFVAQSAALYLIAVTNLSGTGGYTFRAVDTTLFSPRWNTSGGRDVQWGFFNVSDMPITGTLTLLDSNGIVIIKAPVSVQPGSRTTRFTGISDLNLLRNNQGSATFAHNGPPNSILGDAFLVYSDGSAPYPIKFETLAPQ